jgi:transposase
VDFVDGRTVEGAAKGIRLLQRGPSTPLPMGQRGHIAESLAHLPISTQQNAANPLERVLCRRHVRFGEKRGPKVGKTKRGKGSKLMVLADGAGTPLGVLLEAASPAEVKLLPATIQQVPWDLLEARPERLILDRAYDSNTIRKDLADRGIEPIIPARKNNQRATHQDKRKLRRYKKRWKIERTNAWLQNFRRVVIRYERLTANYLAFVHLACALILLRKV